VLFSIAQPAVIRGTKLALDRLFAPGQEGFNETLDRIRARAQGRETAAPPADANGENATGV
jgi:hypothetical protein